MSEPSHEAVVAAEAAGNAVEELHTREAVQDTAHEARIAAETANEQSAQAAEQAQAAAELANQTAEHASREAEQTREAVSEIVANAANGNVGRDEFEAFRSEMAPLLQRHAHEEAERVANEQREAENTVEEVSVENGIGTKPAGESSSGSGSTADTGLHGGDTGLPPARRRGLRHRNSR